MRPELGFIELSTDLGFRASIAPLPEHAAMRAMNCTINEWRKKEKDDKEKKWWARERAKLQRGKRRQGSSEEEDEEKEEDEEGAMALDRPSYGTILLARMRTRLRRR